MKDRALLLFAAAAVAAMAAITFRLEGDYASCVSIAFAVLGVIAYCKRRSGK